MRGYGDGRIDRLERVLKKHNPVLLVEVDNENKTGFIDWVKGAGHEVAEAVQRYRLNKNHLLKPKGGVKAARVAKKAPKTKAV